MWTDKGTKFFSKFCKLLCTIFGTKYLTTTVYYPETDEQGEMFNKTIVTRLQQCLAEHQQEWDINVQPLTKANDAVKVSLLRVDAF